MSGYGVLKARWPRSRERHRYRSHGEAPCKLPISLSDASSQRDVRRGSADDARGVGAVSRPARSANPFGSPTAQFKARLRGAGGRDNGVSEEAAASPQPRMMSRALQPEGRMQSPTLQRVQVSMARPPSAGGGGSSSGGSAHSNGGASTPRVASSPSAPQPPPQLGRSPRSA